MLRLLDKILIIAILSVSLTGSGQESIVNYTKDNGLTSNEITTTFIDSKGTVWIGTTRGLNVYTGSTWSALTSIENQATGKNDPLNSIVAIFEDHNGYMWVSSEKGLFCYTGKYWINFVSKDDEDYVTREFFEDRDGRLWTLEEYYKDLTENIGVILLNGVVQVFDGTENFRFKEYVAGNFFARYIKENTHYFNDHLEDKSGDIWLSSLGGLYRLDENEWIEYSEKEMNCLKTFCLAEDSTGTVWVGTDKGVSVFKDGKWINYDKKDGLNSAVIHKIAVDRSGSIWAYNQDELKSSGLNRFDGDKWTSFSQDDIHLKGTVQGLTFSDDEAITWTNRGISRYIDGKWSSYGRNSGLKDTKYSVLKKDEYDRIWLLGEKRLYLKNGEKWETLLQPEIKLDMEKIFIDHSKHCWIVTSKDGVYKQIDENDWKNYTEASGLVSDNVLNIFQDRQNNIWIVTNKGLSIISE